MSSISLDNLDPPTNTIFRLLPAVGLAAALILVLPTPATSAVPPLPTPDFSDAPTQELVLHFDGTRLPDRIIGASVDFAAPEFVEAVYSTEIHPFAADPHFERSFWTGTLVLTDEVLPGTRGQLVVVVGGLVDGKPIEVVQPVEIVAHAGTEEHTIVLGERETPATPRVPRSPDLSFAEIFDAGAPSAAQTRYPAVPNLEVEFGTGVTQTRIHSKDGVTVHRHITRELRPEQGMYPAVVTMTFERDGELEPVRIVTRITQSEPASPESTVPTYHYDVTQTEDLRSWSYRIDLSYDEDSGILESWIHAGSITERGVYDTVSETWTEPYPDDLDDRLFYDSDAPLAGMDPGYLHKYQGDSEDLLPANTDSVYATEVEIEGNVGSQPGGTPEVVEDDGAPSGDHPNLACVAACAACGATLFMGPTCTQWVDCIDWAENPRKAEEVEPAES